MESKARRPLMMGTTHAGELAKSSVLELLNVVADFFNRLAWGREHKIILA